MMTAYLDFRYACKFAKNQLYYDILEEYRGNVSLINNYEILAPVEFVTLLIENRDKITDVLHELKVISGHDVWSKDGIQIVKLETKAPASVKPKAVRKKK